MILKPVDAAFVLYDAGFRVNGGIVVALATFRGESSLDTDAKNTVGNSPPSTDRGWCQLNSYWHPEVTDACAYDALCAAKEAFRISNKGQSFGSWAIYNSGAYKNYMELAWAAVDAMTRIKAEQAKTAVEQGKSAGLGLQLSDANAIIAVDSATITDLQQQLVSLTADDASLQAQLQEARAALKTALDNKALADAALATMRGGLQSYLRSIEATVTGGPVDT